MLKSTNSISLYLIRATCDLTQKWVVTASQITEAKCKKNHEEMWKRNLDFQSEV